MALEKPILRDPKFWLAIMIDISLDERPKNVILLFFQQKCCKGTV